MNIAIVDPQAFQSQALSWIGVATVVCGAIAGFIGAILAYISKLKSDAAAKQGDADHATSTAGIAALQTAVTGIALKTPTGLPSGPTPVNVTNSPEQPVNVTENKT